MSISTSELSVEIVEYEIAGASEHSGAYVAENILYDKPRDQGSRWSGAIAPANSKQWIRLRLKHICILKSITFGKFHKGHPCNMKEFRVLVGLTENNMTELLHTNLKNDSSPETFSLRSTNQSGMPFPTRFVEIVPLSAHGQSFNTSIWHVSLAGIIDEAYVEQIRVRHQEYREALTLRQVLKHLRQRRFLTPVSQILAGSGITLEHPLITALHDAFVLHGDWPRAEQLLRDCTAAGLFRTYRHACTAQMRWERIRALDADGDVPRERGGHATCFDPEARIIYLFGGWDGKHSLDDFWAYDGNTDAWRLLSPATSREHDGPTPRACHKMVFNPTDGSIYVLGRLGDGDVVEPQPARSGGGASGSTGVTQSEAEAAGNRAAPLASTAAPFDSAWPTQCSEFYRYQTRGPDAGKWERLASDRPSAGGPPLISDHQMEIDTEAQVIYVSGGRVVDSDWDVLRLSGLYSYDIRSAKWAIFDSPEKPVTHPSIPPRWGHSMVLDPKTQTLFIFAGQRDDRYLSDMYAFHVPTNTVTELFSNFTSVGGPNPSFTQRAVIDPEKREIYVLGGLTRKRANAPPIIEASSPYWIYRYDRPELPGKWSKILPVSTPGARGGAEAVPQTRYAHQIVYDVTTDTVYMHGGNAGLGSSDNGPEGDRDSESGESGNTKGHSESDERRLDDFWRLEIVRPSDGEIIRRVLYEVRQQQFREMCEDGPPIKALTFLQTRVAAVVNHSDPDEAKVFRALLSAHLLSAPTRATAPIAAPSSATSRSTTPGPHTTPTSVAAASTSSGAAPASTVIEVRAEAEHDVDQPPRKRSRPSTPAHAPDSKADVESVIRYEADPGELAAEGGVGSTPSPERYKQRTQMFERLLAFVDEGAKQPDTNLVDMLSTDLFLV